MEPSRDQKEFLFQQTYLKALFDNKNNTAKWKDYKEKYEQVIQHLKFYNEKSKHSVCIPVGNKAFVKGQLVHTNDVWVTLGCGYFLKTGTNRAVEICERRIKVADELLEKWEKESKLLESMREYSVSKEAFGGGENSKEIIEPFEEDKEEKWRKDHKEKERKYRQQLKEVKEKTGSAVLQDEKDIWEHLEALELQEELEDELNRLGCSDISEDEYESDSDSSSSDNSVSKADEDDSGKTINKLIQEINPKSDNTVKKINSVKKVTFAEDVDTVEDSKISEKSPSEDIQEAVSDVVVEKVHDPSKDTADKTQKRPVSKFKMNRISSK